MRPFFLVSDAHRRSANVGRSRIADLAAINVYKSAPLASFAINLSESTTFYRQLLNEHNRLCDTTFAAKRYFLESLIYPANTIIERIVTHAPIHPLVAEYEIVTALLSLSATMTQKQQLSPPMRNTNDGEGMRDVVPVLSPRKTNPTLMRLSSRINNGEERELRLPNQTQTHKQYQQRQKH